MYYQANEHNQQNSKHLEVILNKLLKYFLTFNLYVQVKYIHILQLETYLYGNMHSKWRNYTIYYGETMNIKTRLQKPEFSKVLPKV